MLDDVGCDDGTDKAATICVDGDNGVNLPCFGIIPNSFLVWKFVVSFVRLAWSCRNCRNLFAGSDLYLTL